MTIETKKIVTAVCNRCGKRVEVVSNATPYMNGVQWMFVEYEQPGEHAPHRKDKIHLCHECAAGFAAWLRMGKEGKL